MTQEIVPPSWESSGYLDGQFTRLQSNVEVTEKATGRRLGTAGLGGPAELEAAVAAARRAQTDWAAQPYPVRSALLRAVAQQLSERAEPLAELIVRETGAIRGKADYEIGAAIDELHAAAGIAQRPIGSVLTSMDADRRSYCERVPVGVLATLTPWNFPLLLAMRVIAPAIALGNAVILKASPLTPFSGGLAIAALFHDAGAPAGILQALCGEQDFSESLTTHAGVDMVHFTGSTAVGSAIAAAAGSRLKKVSLELGGNNALVVLGDADPDQAAMIGAWSSFHYQGQTCISAGRHLVHESLLEDYVARLAHRARRIVVGDPIDPGTGLGPIISARQAERGESLLRSSVEQGARIVEGGERDGLLFRPSVVTGLSTDMPLWSEEIFAPIAAVMPFGSDEEAVQLVNDTRYGLINAVVTPDVRRGERLARQLRGGMVQVNDATCVDEPAAPFGGIGASGLGGRIGGESNVEEFTEPRWIAVRDTVPQYPY